MNTAASQLKAASVVNDDQARWEAAAQIRKCQLRRMTRYQAACCCARVSHTGQEDR